jgi:hypothetical protein
MADLSLSDQLRLEEYKSLRGEIDAKWQDQRITERLVLFADAVIYGFLAQHPPTPTGLKSWPLFVWLIPSFTAFFGSLRWWEDVRAINQASAYLRQVESSFGKVGLEMWENHLKKLRDKGWSHRWVGGQVGQSLLIAPIQAFFWLVLILVTILLAVWHPQF